MGHVWIIALHLACCLASVTASAWLLVKTSVLKRTCNRFLLARELWHLALANTVAFCIIGSNKIYELLGHLDLAKLPAGSPLREILCVTWHSGNTGAIISTLVELHIALASVLVIFRCTLTLKYLAWTLPIVWPLGVALGAVDAYYMFSNSHGDMAHCHADRDVANLSRVLFPSAVFCFLVYVIGTFKLLGSTHHRALKRALLFLLANVITVGPISVYGIFIDWHSTLPHSRDRFSDVSFLLAGLVNSAVYFFLSHRVRRTELLKMRARQLNDPNGEAPIAKGMDSSRDTATTIQSFGPMFGGREEILVRDVALEAAMAAEDAIAQLQERRIDPMLDGKRVTYAQMCRGLRDQQLSQAQLQEHWNNLQKVDSPKLESSNEGFLHCFESSSAESSQSITSDTSLEQALSFHDCQGGSFVLNGAKVQLDWVPKAV